jgi:hypothetical protein
MRGYLVRRLAIPALLHFACGSSDAGSDADSTTSGGTSSAGAPTSTGGADTTGDAASSSESGAPVPTPPVTEGEFTLLTYNVAGLPEGTSQSMPLEYTPQISPLLNLYDLALVQEDFAYHDLLVADAEHPYQSEPHPDSNPREIAFGDGLNEFSQFEFGALDRVTWAECNGTVDSGSDCLTIKGFFAATHTLSEGIEVLVYDLHMDAGGSKGDIAARDAQVAQLLAHLEANAGERAVIIAGDTNMDEEDEASLVALLDGAGLVDACRALSCGEEGRIDRVMLRSSAQVELTAVDWQVDDRFVDPEGNQLSDHEAVGVTIGWRWTGG